jgi:hypothetical protein
MTGRGRTILLVVVLVAAAILTGDWLVSRARLDEVTIDGYLNPPTVVADGKHSTVLTIQILEHGQPLVGELVQSFLESGSGLLIPEWAYTDENGRVFLTYSPNPLTPYDLAQQTVIRVTDVSIGRLVEVGKDWAIEVGLEAPPDAGTAQGLTVEGQ